MNLQYLYGIKVKTNHGDELLACFIEPIKAGYLSFHYAIIDPIHHTTEVAPPAHQRKLSFLEEIHRIGHTYEAYSIADEVQTIKNTVIQTVTQGYGVKQQNVAVGEIQPPEPIRTWFNKLHELQLPDAIRDAIRDEYARIAMSKK